MPLKPVDAAITVLIGPVIDDTDFKTRETGIAYDAAGMDVDLIVEKANGEVSVTPITLTTGGGNDWNHQGNGYYELEITAAQNAEEGVLRVVGYCAGVLPFASPAYDVVPGPVYDSLVKGTEKLQVDAVQWAGSNLATPDTAGYPKVTVKTGTGAGELSLSSGRMDVGAWKGSTPADLVDTNKLPVSVQHKLAALDLTATEKASVATQCGAALSSYGPLRPTVAGRTLDVSAEGNAGLDWGNVDNADTSVNLSSTTVAAVTGATVSAIGANAVNASALASDAVAEIQSGLATAANQATILGRMGAWTGSGINTLLGAFQALFRKDGDVAVPADINADLGGGAGTADNTTDSLQGIRDAGFSTHSAADVWTPGGRTLTDKSGFSLAPDQSTVTVGVVVSVENEVTADMVSIDGNAIAGTDDQLAARFVDVFNEPTIAAVKTGYKLAADGLDGITADEPTAKPTNFRQWVMWLVQRARRSKQTATTLTVETEAGAAVTAQTLSDDGTTQQMGPPS